MRIIQSTNYKKIANNNKKQLALMLLDWHGGQSSYLYSVGSSWLAMKDVPNENIEGAIRELEDLARNRVPYPQVGEKFEEDFKEIRQLQKLLREEMRKEELFNNEDDINLNLLGYQMRILKTEKFAMSKEKELIEELSELEHKQWWDWAKNILETEDITEERAKRWEEDCFKPYEELTEEMKGFDREWAEKVIKIVKKYKDTL